MPSVFGPGVGGFLLALVLPAALVVILVVVVVRARRNGQAKRTLNWAAKHGLGYVAHDAELLNVSRRAPFGVGEEEARHVIRGTNAAWKWQAFELRFQGKWDGPDAAFMPRRGWQIHQVVAIEVVGPRRFFQIAGRDPQSAHFGLVDSYQAEDPAFTRQYMADTDDPEYFARLLTPEFVDWLDRLLGVRRAALRMESGWLMLITPGPHDLDTLGATVDELAAMPGLRHGGTV